MMSINQDNQPNIPKNAPIIPCFVELPSNPEHVTQNSTRNSDSYGSQLDSVYPVSGFRLLISNWSKSSNLAKSQSRGDAGSPTTQKSTAVAGEADSCIRCYMQHADCGPNENDKEGDCVACIAVHATTRVRSFPCLRYSITKIKLFKPLERVRDLEWTKRSPEDLLSKRTFEWEPSNIRTASISDGYTDIHIKLMVRRFIPRKGDKNTRTWVTSNKEKRSVGVTPYAIFDPDVAYQVLDKHLVKMASKCIKKVVSPHGQVMFKTYNLASDASKDSQVPDDEQKLLSRTLKLWTAIRLTTTSQHIVGEDTLDMQSISDKTNPLHGKVLMPPVLSAQIDAILIERIQTGLREKVLQSLQDMIRGNKKRKWFSLYLVIFIILHNIALIIAHDAGYARKHGLEERFARPSMVEEYHNGANTLLGYFHYCNKDYYPFSADCNDRDLEALAELSKKQIQLIQDTRKYVRSQEADWEGIRQQNQHENIFYYISQLFQKEWRPTGIDVNSPVPTEGQ